MSSPYPDGPPGPLGPPPPGPPQPWAPPASPPDSPPGGGAPGGGADGGPPPGWPPTGPGAPPPARRTGLVLALVGGAAVLVLVGVAVVVLATPGGEDGGRWGDFGAGPSRPPEEQWSVAVDLAEDGPATVISDGDHAFVLSESTDDHTTTVVTSYRAGDGEQLWAIELGSSLIDDPVRLLGADGVLLADEEGGTTRLVDPASGEEEWEVDGVPVDTQLSLGFGPPIDPGDQDLVLLAVADDDDESRVVAVDRASGEERWDAAGGDALVCGDVAVTIVEGEPDPDDFAPTDGEITGRDAATGEELWARDARPGLCDGDEVALVTDDDEITLLAVGDGEEEAVLDIADAGDFLVGIPFGDHVAVSSYSFSDDEGTSRGAVYPRDGGDPTWEGEGAFAFPVTDDLVLTAADDDDRATFVRPADGEEVGDVTITGDDNGCMGALSRSTLVVCETGEPDVTSHRLTDGLGELWTIAAEGGVEQVAVGGDRLFVLTEEEELAAYR